MSLTVSQFREKFRVDDLLVFRNDGWSVSIRPKAPTLGACVISANHHRESLGAISASESADLVDAVAWFEGRLREAFDASRFNYLALMMVDPLLHFHALPRYDSDRTFANMTWHDNAWPMPPDLNLDQSNGDILVHVRERLAAEPRLGSAHR
jgi:diadenosine tetraphosphate (Ap4A) HIT family hydrolase